MKTIFVTLKGKGPVFWMENLNDDVTPYDVDLSMSLSELEDDGILDGDMYELPFALEDIQVLYTEGEVPVSNVDDNGAIDITKEKGKYLLVNDLFSNHYQFNAPFYVEQFNYCGLQEHFVIELEDDEEFDPKKLQLIKSDYELEFLPFAISMGVVLYNGKLITAEIGDGYLSKECESFVYEDDMPYASSQKSVSISEI